MNHTLREIAKLVTGIVLADAIAIVWMASIHMFPLSFLGTTITNITVIPVVLFDAVLALLLAHYGWGIKLPVRTIRERTALYIIGTIFAIVASLHWIRIVFGISIYLGNFVLPVWLSWTAILVTTYLSYLSFHFALIHKK